jgi:hypothetical protein
MIESRHGKVAAGERRQQLQNRRHQVDGQNATQQRHNHQDSNVNTVRVVVGVVRSDHLKANVAKEDAGNGTNDEHAQLLQTQQQQARQDASGNDNTNMSRVRQSVGDVI